MDQSDHLFVYGTLLSVAEHPMGAKLRAHATQIGAGSIQARLYIIDDPDMPGQNQYPGAVPSGNPSDRVYGNVYRLTDPDALLPAFDDYEACGPAWQKPYEFLRRSVPVAMEDGAVLWTISYLYTWDVSGAVHVPSGRFTEVAPDVR